jgi:tetratricopeptide (TPR) repeat protein
MEGQVLNRILKTVLGVTLAYTLTFAQTPAPAQPQVKDQGEYDLMTAINKEQDPSKKLTLLDQWTDKYPDTQFKQNRVLTYIQTDSAVAQKAVQPNAPEDAVAAGQKAANTLIEKADTFFSAENKPATVQDDAWATAKKQVLLQAHGILGNIAMNKKDYTTAEGEFNKVLALDPNQAATAYQLGVAIMGQKKTDRYPEAMWQFARAAQTTGPGALNDAGKKQTDDYLKRVYSNYHGDATGLDDLKAKALSSPTIPSDFHIKSITEISQEANSNAEEFAKQFPQIMVWRGLKDKLAAADAEEFFKANMKEAEMADLKGKVVSQPSQKELLVSMDYASPDTATKPEVTLKFETPLKGQVEAGTLLTFTGVPESFTKEPFMLVMTAEKSKVDGLGDAAGTDSPSKKAPAKKKAAVTKKKAATK